MQNIKTIAGTFTIGTYEIPKQYVCAKTPTITQKNDICEIVTYDQQITVNGHNYAPVLHQNCMQPEQITLYPLVIRQEHATLTVSDRYHTGHWKSGDDTQISDWRPKLMHRGCVPCTNCGRSVEIKPKKIGEKFFYRLLFTGKPVDGNRFSVNDRKQNQRRQKK